MVDYIFRNRNYFLFALLLALIYFPIFLHLTYMPIRMWDESMVGVNAIQMANNHNYIVSYFNGYPDMYMTKPPLVLWCIVFFIKILGFSELSLRLPSALAAAILCIYLYHTLKRYTSSPVFAFITIVVLITCHGYIRNHVTRTGEYDSILTLFTTLASLNLFFAAETADRKEQSRYLLLFFVWFTLATLSKGIACFMFAPGLLTYVVMRKKLVAFLKNKALYAGLVIFIVFGLGFYFLRESINPGYLKAVWLNELGGRFMEVNEGHSYPFTFYLSEITGWQFVEYMFVFPLALLIGAFLSPPNVKRLLLFSVVAGGSFLLVISMSATKLPHYDAPLFPFLAIITASFFFFIYTVIKGNMGRLYGDAVSSAIGLTIILVLLLKPYSDTIANVYFPKGDTWEEGFSVACKYFQYAVQGRVKEENCKLVFDPVLLGPGTVLECYTEELNEHHIKNEIISHDQVKINEKVIVFDPYLKQLIDQKFVTEEVHLLPFCNGDVIYIKSEKAIAK